MKTSLLFLFLLFCIFIVTTCQQSPTSAPAQLKRVAFQSQIDQEAHDFFLYLPKGYDQNSNNKFPVLLFLHGNGERGNGKAELDYVMIHGPLYEAWIQKRDLPFIIIAPQLPMMGMDTMGKAYINDRDTSWIPKRLAEGVPPRGESFKTTTPMLGAVPVDTFPENMITLPVGWDKIDADLMTILDLVLTAYQADEDKVYLSGISYGGFGTWWVASHHPERFAAIAPIVGWGHPSLMGPIAANRLPVWAFAGGRDRTIEARYFYQGMNELEKLGHKDIQFTIHADSGHDAWRRIYAGEDLYDWLLAH